MDVNTVLETMFATAKLGAIFAPMNFRLAPPPVTHWPVRGPCADTGGRRRRFR